MVNIGEFIYIIYIYNVYILYVLCYILCIEEKGSIELRILFNEGFIYPKPTPTHPSHH